MSEAVILGGGLTGLSAAFHLGINCADTSYRIIEKSDRPGGLLRTEHQDGFLFDATGHWLHLRDESVRRLIERLLPQKLIAAKRVARIYSHKVFTRYPFQINTFGLPPNVIAECLEGFVDATIGEKGRPLREESPKTFADFILRHLGEGFAKHFMFPYNEKIYTVHPRELTAEWCGRFVPRPTLREVIDGAVGLGKDQVGYNATFLYPNEGGIETLAKSFVKSLAGHIDCMVEPLNIDWQSHKVTLSDGRILSYSALLSTISLPDLIQLMSKGGNVPETVLEASSKLRATTVTYVNIAATGKGRGMHWVYFPEKSFSFYRAGSYSAVYEKMAPRGHQSFYVEFAHQNGGLSELEAEKQAIDGLVQSGMLARNERVLFASVRTIPNAYVLHDCNYGEARRTIFGFLEHAGVLVAGRYGRWEYSSMEDAIIAGRDAANKLVLKRHCM